MEIHPKPRPDDDLLRELRRLRDERKMPKASWGSIGTQEPRVYVVEFSLNGDSSQGLHIFVANDEDGARAMAIPVLDEWARKKSGGEGGNANAALKYYLSKDHVFGAHLLTDRAPFTLVEKQVTDEEYAQENPRHWANLCQLLRDAKAETAAEKKLLTAMAKRLAK